jgi:signal transduction histidine kinase
VRDYSASVPRIQAYPGELNQVWTNLIDNALDAMNGAGTLRLATRAEEDDIVVEVGDTGPGMPPQIASRAFDAFYTTKEAGKGTGLGLDIARRTVVERHGGLITIDSRPGNTVLRVRLPIRPARAHPRSVSLSAPEVIPAFDPAGNPTSLHNYAWPRGADNARFCRVPDGPSRSVVDAVR